MNLLVQSTHGLRSAPKWEAVIVFFARTARIDHAWHIVGVGFVVSLLASGTRFATGPFMASMMASFRMTHTQFSAVVAFSMLLYGFFMPVAGRLADLFGGRPVLLAGGVLLSTALAVTARTTSPVVFALAFALVASLGFAATSHVALASVIGRWFVKRRGLAMTFLSSGAMSGIAIMVPFSASLIARIGWRGTMLVIAAVLLVVVLVGAVVMGGQPPQAAAAAGEKRPSPPDWRRALGTQPFWLMVLGFFTCGFSMNLLGTHGVPMLEDHGFSTMTAAFGVGLIGLVSVFGSLALGAASDRLGRPTFLALIYAVRGLGFIGLLFAGREWELYAVGAIGGLVWSGSSALTSAITADLFGAESVGTLFGLIFLSHQIGAAMGSYLGGWAFDAFGSYLVPFVIAAVLLFGAAYLSMRLPARSGAPGTSALAAD
ncbi:MAG TPA: MFS transporter [Symbiobacteriaceae bacterium]|jgi:MFS family permease